MSRPPWSFSDNVKVRSFFIWFVDLIAQQSVAIFGARLAILTDEHTARPVVAHAIYIPTTASVAGCDGGWRRSQLRLRAGSLLAFVGLDVSSGARHLGSGLGAVAG